MGLAGVNKQSIYAFVFISFAFDSLFKVNAFGVRVHVGILSIMLFMLFAVSSSMRFHRLIGFFRDNWSIIPFFVYMIITLIFNNLYPGTFKVTIYFFLAVVVFYCVYAQVEFLPASAIARFQWVLVLTGIFQFSLFKILGYQLAFYDAEHYLVNASFAVRMRGFFVEPNWYSIILSFNSLLLVSVFGKNLLKKKWLMLLSITCFILNASYTFVGIVVMVMIFETIVTIRRVTVRRLFFLFSMLMLLVVLLITRGNLQSDGEAAINYGSRLFPVVRTVDFMADQIWTRQVFGFGLGGWPYYGIYNKLGYPGMFGDYEVVPAKRDSAEVQVFILELGYLGLFLLLFDFVYNYFKYRRINILFSVACAFMAACYFIYPVYNFIIYMVPYYVLRSQVVKER